MDMKLSKTLICLLLILAGVVSFFVIGARAGSVEAHTDRIAEIDDKISTVLKLTATSTVAAAGISSIPGDTATPIAEKIADFSEYFLLILCVLYTEKYLLTILGIGAFKIIIPVACLALCAAVWFNHQGLKSISYKLVAFALALYFAIPMGLSVSDKIYETYKESIDTTLVAADTMAADTSILTDAVENQSAFSSILNGVSETVSGLTDKAASLLKRYVESLAVLIVTTCVIPLLVVLFIVWMTKLLLGRDSAFAIPSPPAIGGRREHRRPE